LNNKLPKMDGLQVLKWIRESETFHHLPVIMFTSTENEAEQIRSYDLGVNAYLVKPMSFKKLSETIRMVNKFWNLAEIPQDC
jgi:DNA-binding response OmpR family regulator